MACLHQKPQQTSGADGPFSLESDVTSIAHPLCIADDTTFWPWRSWPEFASWRDRERTLVIVPVVGMADWGLEQPLDLEEAVLMTVLHEAARRRLSGLALLVVPPLRFVAGPSVKCAFAVASPIALQLIEEVIASVAAAGFRRIVLFNSSPGNEELCETAACDLRVERGLQMFCVHLTAIGLDLHPVRGGDRAALREFLVSLASGRPAAAQTSAGDRLVSLLVEMRDRAPLADGGAIKPVTPP